MLKVSIPCYNIIQNVLIIFSKCSYYILIILCKSFHDFVLGLFPFHRHPHANLISATSDYMHAFYNVVKDTIRSTRPRSSGDTTLGKNENRTYKAYTRDSCAEFGYHKKLHQTPLSFDSSDGKVWKPDVPPWVFTKRECTEADQQMDCIIGPPGTRRITKVMKRGHADNTHDTLEWAFVFARWCWRGKGSSVYVNNILDLFDVLSIMTSSTMKIDTVCESINVLI